MTKCTFQIEIVPRGGMEKEDGGEVFIPSLEDPNLLIYQPQEKGTGCSGKIVFFFTMHCNPSLGNIAVRDLPCSQRSASVQSLLLAGNFLYNQ